ncbi:MAG: CPBP family intramembrane metalloprotease [Ignavibacterium sp.]|nr:CPBP family intramembrane metalloprotease [Ignavibacterium sp.]
MFEENNNKKDSDNNFQFENLEPRQQSFSPIFAGFVGLVGCFFLYQIVGSLLAVLIFGFDLEKASINSIRIMTIAGQLLFILLPALLFAKYFYIDINRVISLKLPNIKEILLFTFGLLILSPLLQIYLYIQNYYIELLAKKVSVIKVLKDLLDHINNLVEKTYGNLLQSSNVFEFIFIVFVVAVVPAISEETMFRGFVQRSFEQRLSPFLSSFITAIFFSLYHFNPYGLIPLAILGIYFGLSAYYSKSLIVPIILHFLNNFSAIVVYHIIGSEDLIKSDVKANPEDLTSYLVYFIFLISLFVALIFTIRKYYNTKKL